MNMNTPKWARDRRPRNREHDELLMYFDFTMRDINNVQGQLHYEFSQIRYEVELMHDHIALIGERVVPKKSKWL